MVTVHFGWQRKTTDPTSRRFARRRRTAKIAMLILFSAFTLVGGGLLYPFGIRPILKTASAESWQEVRCRIISAEVGVHRGEDSTTYSVDIVYEYEFGGRTYKSDRYIWAGCRSSSGSEEKRRVVEYYKTAERPVCFVNPDKPSEAVLVRGYHSGLLFVLVPLLFFAIGVVGLIFSIRWIRRTARPKPLKWLPETKGVPMRGGVDSAAAQPVLLRPRHSPWVKLISTAVFAGLWNGFVYTAVYYTHWSLVPVVLAVVGLGLIGLVFYMLLALANPRPTLTLSRMPIPVGGRAQMEWDLSGSVSRIHDFKILLRAREEATYQSGKNTHTAKNTLWENEIYSTQDSEAIRHGRADIVVPADAMHSFEADSNKIIWEIVVHGKIESWPDVKEPFKITIAPREAK